jgi:hypothetical protein
MGVALLLFNLSRPRRLIELSKLTQTASRTVAENTPRKDFSALMLAEPKLAFEVLRVLAAEVHTTRTAIAQCPQSILDDEQSKHPMPELVNPTVS